MVTGIMINTKGSSYDGDNDRERRVKEGKSDVVMYTTRLLT